VYQEAVAWRVAVNEGNGCKNSTGNETGVSLHLGVNIDLKNLFKNTIPKIFAGGF
jgi:hypothetical protein